LHSSKKRGKRSKELTEENSKKTLKKFAGLEKVSTFALLKKTRKTFKRID